MKNFVLIGMMGSGKSTLGYNLSKTLGMSLIDTDLTIQKFYNLQIKSLFFLYGEKFFRFIEKDLIKKISNFNNLIISTGGGVVLDFDNIISLKKNSHIIFINRPIQNILHDIDLRNRPLLKNHKNIYKIYEERLFLYKKYCDVEILNNKSLKDAENSILEYIDFINTNYRI